MTSGKADRATTKENENRNVLGKQSRVAINQCNYTITAFPFKNRENRY